MAWFHHALQSSNQPQASMMNPSMTNPSMMNPSMMNPSMMNPSMEALSEAQVSSFTSTQGWPTLPPVSMTDFPSAPGCIVPQRLEDLICTSLNTGSREDPAPLSYVTLQEQRCVLSWFLAWNVAQRQRFLEDLTSKAVPGKVSSLLDQLNTLQVNDRPPNIFECQLRLWTQWFDSWSEEERNGFLNSLEERDPLFVVCFYNRVAGTAGRE